MGCSCKRLLIIAIVIAVVVVVVVVIIVIVVVVVVIVVVVVVTCSLWIRPQKHKIAGDLGLGNFLQRMRKARFYIYRQWNSQYQISLSQTRNGKLQNLDRNYLLIYLVANRKKNQIH